MDKIAMEKRVSLTELSKLAEETDEVDKKLDAEQIKLKDQKEFIIDSRLGWFFIPNSMTIGAFGVKDIFTGIEVGISRDTIRALIAPILIIVF